MDTNHYYIFRSLGCIWAVVLVVLYYVLVQYYSSRYVLLLLGTIYQELAISPGLLFLINGDCLPMPGEGDDEDDDDDGGRNPHTEKFAID